MHDALAVSCYIDGRELVEFGVAAPQAPETVAQSGSASGYSIEKARHGTQGWPMICTHSSGRQPISASAVTSVATFDGTEYL